LIPKKLKSIVNQIDEVITELSQQYSDNSDVKYLKTLLINLKNSVDVKSDRDSVIIQIN
jgi:hypothetical protein